MSSRSMPHLCQSAPGHAEAWFKNFDSLRMSALQLEASRQKSPQSPRLWPVHGCVQGRALALEHKTKAAQLIVAVQHAVAEQDSLAMPHGNSLMLASVQEGKFDVTYQSKSI